MFRRISHTSGLQEEAEILFSTQFDYFFPDAARSPLCLLPAANSTLEALKELGDLMGDPGEVGHPAAEFDAPIPAVFTYFGQFIDHDITARTDRNGAASTIGDGLVVSPLDPDLVVRELRNGRRPELDLDSVFGDGPGLSGSALRAQTQSSILYKRNLTLDVFEQGGRVDVPRDNHKAIIADMRNDENIIISQLQATFLRFYNAIYELQQGSSELQYVRARQLVRWAYQYVVVNDYLTRVCDRGVVLDTLANGPRFMGSSAGRGNAFMPLEFSVAGFRFGHSMIRPFYILNDISGEVPVQDLLGPSGHPANFLSDGHLAPNRVVNFRRMIGPADDVLKARKLDTKLARGLFMLPFDDRRTDDVLKHLAKSNLVRGYNLSLPTGQAMCDGMGIEPLRAETLREGETEDIANLLRRTGFDQRTPLWYYVLREAAVQQNGERLGELGSRLVAETIIGLLKQDPNSYLNNRHDPAIQEGYIEVGPNNVHRVDRLRDIFRISGAEGF